MIMLSLRQLSKYLKQNLFTQILLKRWTFSNFNLQIMYIGIIITDFIQLYTTSHLYNIENYTVINLSSFVLTIQIDVYEGKR